MSSWPFRSQGTTFNLSTKNPFLPLDEKQSMQELQKRRISAQKQLSACVGLADCKLSTLKEQLKDYESGQKFNSASSSVGCSTE
jgi:hypothetical protein